MPVEPTPPPELVSVQRFLNPLFMRADPVTVDPSLAQACTAHVAGNARITPAGQVDIYRRQFWIRHEDALREDFPGLQHILGEDGFTELVRDYLLAEPPCTPSLRDLGAHMARFIDGYGGLPADRADLARDMVRYELAFVDVFDGPDPPPLDAAVIAALPPEAWETARIVLNPAVARLRFDYPVHRVRLAAREAESSDAGSAPLVHPPAGDVHLALFRHELMVRFEELPADAFALLEALGAGDSLVAACDRVVRDATDERKAELAGLVSGWFQRWASFGFIAEVAAR